MFQLAQLYFSQDIRLVDTCHIYAKLLPVLLRVKLLYEQSINFHKGQEEHTDEDCHSTGTLLCHQLYLVHEIGHSK
jgi:hypothetical protein